MLIPVRVGRTDETRAELLAGLESSDEVVINWSDLNEGRPDVVIAGPQSPAASAGGSSGSAAVLLP
jgi:hypothetical protein